MVNAMELLRGWQDSQSERESRRTLAELAQRKFMAEQEMQPGRMEEQRLSNLAKMTALQNYGPEMERKRQAEANSQNLMRERLGVMERMNAAKIAASEKRGGVALKEKAPVGYRYKPDGSLEAIPGGPADTKMQGAFNQDTSTLNTTEGALDRLANAANQVKLHPGLGGITGLSGMLPNIPGGDAANAAAKLQTLKAQVGFNVLQEMRNASKTGGALGSITEKELGYLQNALDSLDTAQSEKQIKDSLDEIMKFTEASKGRLRNAYNMKHSGRAGDQQERASGGASGDFGEPPSGAVRRKK